MAGKATAEKTISLSNLSRFKGKCDEKYRLYFHTITISDNNNTRHVRFTVPSSSGDAVNTFLGLYLLLGEGKIYVSGNADGDSNLCADDLNIHAVKLTNG